MSEDRIYIERKGLSLIFKGLGEKDIKIPSQMYPLPQGPMCAITESNSEDFHDDEKTEIIRKIFDSIIPETGRCYSNTQLLLDALHEAGIKEAQSYVGWVIVGGALPVHHCFATVGKHILDFTEKLSTLVDDNVRAAKNIDEARALLVENAVKSKDLPNSQKATFGKADKNTLYVATPCSPEDGPKQFKKMIKTYPNHPSYTNIYANGSNKTQDILRKCRGEPEV